MGRDCNACPFSLWSREHDGSPCSSTSRKSLPIPNSTSSMLASVCDSLWSHSCFGFMRSGLSVWLLIVNPRMRDDSFAETSSPEIGPAAGPTPGPPRVVVGRLPSSILTANWWADRGEWSMTACWCDSRLKIASSVNRANRWGRHFVPRNSWRYACTLVILSVDPAAAAVGRRRPRLDVVGRGPAGTPVERIAGIANSMRGL